MEEASYLCDRLLVIDGGNILVQGALEELVEQYVGAEVVELRAAQPEKVPWWSRCVTKGWKWKTGAIPLWYISKMARGYRTTWTWAATGTSDAPATWKISS
jgi:ABC-type multidrug transport system ATPase subunit